MPEYLDKLSKFAIETKLEDIPSRTIEQTRFVIADTVAAIAAGSAEPEMKALTARRIRDSGPCSVIGTGIASTPQRAALLNGTAGTWLEMDEGNRFARGHPSVHVLPAALAYAEMHRVGGGELLLSVIVGYEIAARIGIAANLRPSMHPHGTWGTIGAAVAVGKLARIDPKHLSEVINIASSLTIATSKNTMLQGGTVRNIYAGMANQNGMLAVELADCGFVGEHDGLSGVFGTVVSETFDSERMVAGLGETWQVDQNYFKRHSCCRFNHGALDALERILAGNHVRPDDVRSVEVATYNYAAELDQQVPRNVLGAKFSVPFAIATRLVTGSSGLQSFTWDRVRDPQILALAGKVTVREDAQLTARLPQFRPARVTIHLNDGRTFDGSTDVNRGDDQAPYSREELDEKFFELASRVWPLETSQAIHADLHRLESLADLSGLSRSFDAVQEPLRKAG